MDAAPFREPPVDELRAAERAAAEVEAQLALPDWLCLVLVEYGENGDRARHQPHSRRPWQCRVCGARAAEGKSWHFDADGIQL